MRVSVGLIFTCSFDHMETEIAIKLTCRWWSVRSNTGQLWMINLVKCMIVWALINGYALLWIVFFSYRESTLQRTLSFISLQLPSAILVLTWQDLVWIRPKLTHICCMSNRLILTFTSLTRLSIQGVMSIFRIIWRIWTIFLSPRLME